MGDIRWEKKSTESKNRLLGGQKTTTVSNRMDYAGITNRNSKYKKPVKTGEATTITKTNRKGELVREKKIITPNSGPTTVVKTNRSGNQKIKTKNDRAIKYDTKGEPKVKKRHTKQK